MLHVLAILRAGAGGRGGDCTSNQRPPAGILDPEDHGSTTVEMAVLADPGLTERQKHVLIEIHSSFVKENERNAADLAAAAPDAAAPGADERRPAPDPTR